MKVYTKKGDGGTTSLLSGARINKGTPTIKAVGALDELNSFIGLLRSELSGAYLEEIQWNLFNAGAVIINDTGANLKQITEEDIEKLEQAMDEMDAVLPKLKNFILPQGTRIVSLIHICRAVCRRAEVDCLGFAPTIITKYLNRLSDYFFVLARYSGFLSNTEERIWKNDKV